MYIQYNLLIFNSKGELSMNFGEYFRGIMSKYDITLTDLANASGVKSKNELYRLIENKYSYEKTNELTKKILSVVEVSDGEKNKLYNLMNECKIKYSERKANHILSKLYLKDGEKTGIGFNLFLDFIKENIQKILIKDM